MMVRFSACRGAGRGRARGGHLDAARLRRRPARRGLPGLAVAGRRRGGGAAASPRRSRAGRSPARPGRAAPAGARRRRSLARLKITIDAQPQHQDRRGDDPPALQRAAGPPAARSSPSTSRLLGSMASARFHSSSARAVRRASRSRLPLFTSAATMRGTTVGPRSRRGRGRTPAARPARAVRPASPTKALQVVHQRGDGGVAIVGLPGQRPGDDPRQPIGDQPVRACAGRRTCPRRCA